MAGFSIISDKASRIMSAITDFFAIPDEAPERLNLKITHAASNQGNHATLHLDVKNLARDRVQVTRVLNTLTIRVLKDDADSVIYSDIIGHTPSSTKDDQASLASQYDQITWSRSSAQEISFFLRSLPVEDFWEARSARIIRVILAALVELRNDGHIQLSLKIVKEHLPLEAIYRLSCDERLSSDAIEGLTTILNETPGFLIDDAKSHCINGNAISHHGFLTMAITESFRRLLSPPVDSFEYETKAPFREVTAEISGGSLLIKIAYQPTEEDITVKAS